MLVLGVLVLGLCPGGAAHAQGPWTAMLFVDPFPSPYASDWETNPNVSTLTIINPTGVERDVRLVYQVANSAGRVLASGRSDPLPIPPGAPTVFTSYIDIAGSSQRDAEIRRQMEQTGRIPEGVYQACVTMADGNGFVLGDSCASFTIVYPDPPVLLSPGDGEVVSAAAPFFLWTPIQVPPAFQVRYVLQVAALLPNQTPEEALLSTIVHFQGPDIETTNFLYPTDGQPFEPGKRYVWRVMAVDQNGFPPSTGGGGSEIRTFRFDDGTGAAALGSMAVTFSMDNAFDEVVPGPEGEPEAVPRSAGNGSSSYPLTEVCEQWSRPPSELQLFANIRWGFRGFRNGTAVLHRTEEGGERKWWLFARSDRDRSVLMHGICTDRDRMGFQWLATRKPGRNQKLNEWLDINGLPNGPVDKIDYGVFIVAWKGGEVAVPGGFREGSEFLGEWSGRLEVKRGLTAFAAINLREGKLWESLQALGFGDNQITIQGFLGLDVERAIGVRWEGGVGADVSQQRSFFVLTASLPPRTPVGFLSGLASRAQLAVEIEIKDSTGVDLTSQGSKTKYSREIVTRLVHTLTLRPDRFRVEDEQNRELVGWIGADVAGERQEATSDPLNRSKARLVGGLNAVSNFVGAKAVAGVQCAPKRPDLEWKTDLVISYGMSGKLYLGDHFYLSDPALEVHFGPKPKEKDKPRKVVVGFSSHFGVAGFPQEGIFGISGTWNDEASEGPSPRCVTRPRSNAIVMEGGTPPETNPTPPPPPNGPARGPGGPLDPGVPTSRPRPRRQDDAGGGEEEGPRHRLETRLGCSTGRGSRESDERPARGLLRDPRPRRGRGRVR